MDIHMDIHGYQNEVLDILWKSELWISWISIWTSKVSDSQMWREMAPHRVSDQAYQTLIQLLTRRPELDRSPGGRPGPIVHANSVSSSLEPNVCAAQAPVVRRRVSVSCGRWRSCQAVTASLVQWPTMTVMLPPQPPIPPCIKGVASSTAQHDCSAKPYFQRSSTRNPLVFSC